MSPYPDDIWYYKNFNMVVELDISGTFIYDGIQALTQMTSVDETASLFSFLYHTAVGIERLQKIVIVLFEHITAENQAEFESKLKTHSHTALNQRICKSRKAGLNARENEFLQLLSDFYKTARYQRFFVTTEFIQEQTLVTAFVKKYLATEQVEGHFITKRLLITEGIQKLFGRIIGSISHKYYQLVHDGCALNGTYTYELHPGSKAEKVFLLPYRDHSLQEQKRAEANAIKELVVFLRNAKERSPFMRFLEKIPPLELDAELLPGYLSEICNGVIPQDLLDEVETLYEESKYSAERMRQLDIVGDASAVFWGEEEGKDWGEGWDEDEKRKEETDSP